MENSAKRSWGFHNPVPLLVMKEEGILRLNFCKGIITAAVFSNRGRIWTLARSLAAGYSFRVTCFDACISTA